MKRVWIGVLLAAFVVALAGVRQSPELRSKAYSELRRGWSAHWPFARGRSIPTRIRPYLEPLVPVRIELEPGVSLLLNPADLVARELFERGRWEPETWAVIERNLPEGGTFVDVGAHIGYHTLKAARRVGSTGLVVAIEPNPDTVHQLQENVFASRADIVRVVAEACAEVETELELYSANRANTGMSSVSLENAKHAGSIESSHRVRARPLDAILEEAAVSRVDVIKIDVEGVELLVLKGARKTLVEHSPVLIVEMVDRQLEAMGASVREVTQFLGSPGYTARETLVLDVVFAKP